MSNKIAMPIIFAAGAAIGALVAWKYCNREYEEIPQKEIEKDGDEMKYNLDICDKNGRVIGSTAVGRAKNFTDSSPAVSYAKKEDTMAYSTEPYVITPEQFGEKDEYDLITLYYHINGVLADDDDTDMVDVESTVGRNALTHFGEYEKDSVYVRNDILKCDYEILFNEEPFQVQERIILKTEQQEA